MSLIVTRPLTRTYSGVQRRAFPRRRASGAAGYRIGENKFAPAMPAKLVDMCQGGVGLVIRDSLNEGDKIVVELTPPTGRHPITHMAEVRWSQPLVDGLYRIGCSFEHRLDFAEMQNYV